MVESVMLAAASVYEMLDIDPPIDVVPLSRSL